MADAKKYVDLIGLTEYWSKYKDYTDGLTESIDMDTLTEILGAKISKILKTVEFESLAPLSSSAKFVIDYNTLYAKNKIISLTITAKDVTCKSTTTTISYTAVYNTIITATGEVNNDKTITVTGTDKSSEFDQNTSKTDTVTRTISYTYDGLTATTTITQGAWIDTVEADYITLNDKEYANSVLTGESAEIYTSFAQGWSVDTENNPDTSQYALYTTDYSNHGQEGTNYMDYSTGEITENPGEYFIFMNALFGQITGVSRYVAYINSPIYGDYASIMLLEGGDSDNGYIDSEESTCDDIDDTFNSTITCDMTEELEAHKLTWSDLDPSKTYTLVANLTLSYNMLEIDEYKPYMYSKILVPLSLS